MKISVHSLVKNEERYLWYSVMSIVNQVDEVLLWDTGSTDGSIEIAKQLQKQFPDKIKLRFFNDVDKDEFTKLRQKMLEETKADWVFILDGDEVWWEESVLKMVEEIKNGECSVIVSPFVSPVGDIFHNQENGAGRYRIDGRIGNITIRAFRKDIKGLVLAKDYGKEGYVDASGKFIQESELVKRKFVDAPFLHLTHLERSSRDKDVMQRERKLKHELGNRFALDYYYPEAFFRPRPDIVESPWKVFDRSFLARALIETPLRKIKRKLLI